jgi:hypothetical protein
VPGGTKLFLPKGRGLIYGERPTAVARENYADAAKLVDGERRKEDAWL